MEEREELKVYMVRYRCNVCKTGFLNYVKGLKPDDATTGKYPNMCSNQSCKHTELLPAMYPFKSYKP